MFVFQSGLEARNSSLQFQVSKGWLVGPWRTLSISKAPTPYTPTLIDEDRSISEIHTEKHTHTQKYTNSSRYVRVRRERGRGFLIIHTPTATHTHIVRRGFT